MCAEIVRARTFTIQTDPEEITGKYSVAIRDFEPGAFLLEEPPLFQYCPTSEVTKVGQCVTCGEGIKGAHDPKTRDKFRCSLCAWPVCSSECEKAPIHSLYECRVFTENDGIYPEEKEQREKEETLGEFIMIARAFAMRSRKPALWDEILNIMPMYSVDEFNGLSTTLLMNMMMKGRSVSPMKSVFPKFLYDDEEEKIIQHEFRAQITVLARRVGFSIVTDRNL
jgi:hypothetical protein